MPAKDQFKTTCATCLHRSGCTSLCEDMNAVLSRVTRTRESPESAGLLQINSAFDTALRSPDDPEELLINGESRRVAENKIWLLIAAYASKLSRRLPSKKAQIEKLLAYSLVDGFSVARTTELLAEEYPEYREVTTKEVVGTVWSRCGGESPVRKQSSHITHELYMTREVRQVIHWFWKYARKWCLKEGRRAGVEISDVADFTRVSGISRPYSAKHAARGEAARRKTKREPSEGYMSASSDMSC
jgi:hypothetical protein